MGFQSNFIQLYSIKNIKYITLDFSEQEDNIILAFSYQFEGKKSKNFFFKNIKKSAPEAECT